MVESMIMENNSSKQKIWNTFRDYMEYFLIYAFFGWIYESIWCCMIYHKRGFINRGVLFGPWLPIYAFVFFFIWGLFSFIKVKKAIPVFLIGTAVATLAELGSSYIIDMVLGRALWDYHGYFMNFDGRIALEPSLMFGLLICAAVCLIHPAIIKLHSKIRDSKVHNIIFIIITVLFVIDLTCRIWLGSNMK